MAENRLLSLTEIFNQKIFRIPDFQRGYSWELDQLEDFWDDIENLKDDKVHYTGLLTVEPINRINISSQEKWQDDLWLFEKGLSAYYVIDGQQRLTTAIIFINQILQKFNDEEGINLDYKKNWVNRFLYQNFGADYKSYIFGYEKDNPSDEYFKTKILEQQSSTSDRVPEQTLYTYNLKFAKSFFEKKFKKLNKIELQDLFKKITNKLKFNFYEIDEELDVFVTFETMNNRGKPLSNLELLKNRLIYLSTLINDDLSIRNRLRKDVNEVWKTIYEFLGKNKDNPLDDDVFLYNHWIMYFKYNRSFSESYAHYLLHDKFTAKAVLKGKLEFQEIKDYINSLSECVKMWFYMWNVNYSAYGEDIKEWLQKLDRLGMGAFPPLIMAVMSKEKNESEILKLLQAAEKFIFLVFRVSQRPSNTQNNHFYRLANLYYFSLEIWEDQITDIDIVIENITFLTHGHNKDDEYVGWFDLEKFQANMKDLAQKADGYYSWSGLKYFLYEYELHLQSKARGNQKVSWADFNKRKKEDTIEHIYPQTPKYKCWIEAFGDKDKKEKKALLHSLGNLVLLSQSKNSELQNKCFTYKKKHEDANQNDTGFFNGSYSEIEVSAYDCWTANEINKRGIKMLKFMEKRWGIDMKDWGIAKETLLNLDFIKNEQ